MEELETPSSVRGYHIYKDTWEATVGEELECIREPTNSTDRYAVAVTKDSRIAGYLPQMSKICSLLLRRGGCIHAHY